MNLRINETGIRTGEFITSNGKSKQNKGTIIQVSGWYPPDKSRVNSLTSTQLRDEFNTIPFFSTMTYLQRKEWLLENGVDNHDLYINDIPDVKIKFVKIGDTKNAFYTKLGQDLVNRLLQGNPNDSGGYWPITEVMEMFPRKPNSRTRTSRVTLVFRPSMWSLMIPKRLVNTYDGVYVVLNTGQVASGTINTSGGKIYNFALESKVKSILPEIAIVVTQNRSDPISEELLFGLAGAYVDLDEMIRFKEIIKWFPPSLHKSLIQKLIRTRCDHVEYSGKMYSASCALLTSFTMLLMNPGVFVPNIRRFVTGIESATKRLAVSIHEDSFTTKNNLLTMLYASSIISQDDRNWLPTDDMINSWLVLALEAQKEGKMYDYDFKSFNGQISRFDQNSVSYILLSEVRSFQSDIDMVGSIAQRDATPRTTYDGKITIMPLIHCLDHHSLTVMAHYMPYTTKPYSEIFGKIWREVVGVNPRYIKYKDYYLTMEQQPFVKTVRIAQRDVWINMMYLPQPRIAIQNINSDFKYKLDPSWLAGLVGPMEIRLTGGSTAIVVLRVDDIHQMTAVKRPQRDTKVNPELTEQEQIIAIEQAKRDLRNGIMLSNVPCTLPLLKKSKVTLVEDQYIITLSNGEKCLWEIITNLVYKFPVHTSLDPIIINSLLYTGDGIDQKSGEAINYIMTNFNVDSLRRLSTYLTGYKSTIELAKISRDGSGTYYQVVPEDTAVHQILCYLCVMYPVALLKTKNGFKVKTGPLLWTIRDIINQKLGVMTKFDRRWVVPKPEIRQRWEHQIDSYNQMVERHSAGKKGHLIWIKVGLGKTLITIDYLDYLIREGKMPSYCVYSLPSSAINNIVKEMNIRGIPTKVLDARMSSKSGSNIIEPYKVCLIKHDHMRLNGMDKQLKLIAKDMVFIVDEFHKTLSKTIRTSLALELSRLSFDFIGMSGTIIKDTNYDELIQWLEQIVEFEVTEHNYWVAIGGLVSKKVYTKVVVDRQVTAINMSPVVAEQYNKMVPENLGGSARQIDFRGAVNLCYVAITQHIIKSVLDYVKLGEGVFVVAKDIKHQQSIRESLISQGMTSYQIHLFDSDNQITLTSEYDGPVKVVITTKQHSEGYTLTKFRIMITSVYFSNQATREQLEGRINRIGQISPMIRIHIYHTGILTYIHQKYEKVRTLAAALKGFAGEVGIDYQQIKNI